MENIKNNEEEIVELKKAGVIRKCVASIIDQYICFGLAVIAVYVFNLLLNLIGYGVADFMAVLMIGYGIMNVLYFAILDSSKLNTTLGRKLLKC